MSELNRHELRGPEVVVRRGGLAYVGDCGCGEWWSPLCNSPGRVRVLHLEHVGAAVTAEHALAAAEPQEVTS